jgi:hypothetical protein
LSLFNRLARQSLLSAFYTPKPQNPKTPLQSI